MRSHHSPKKRKKDILNNSAQNNINNTLHVPGVGVGGRRYQD